MVGPSCRPRDDCKTVAAKRAGGRRALQAGQHRADERDEREEDDEPASPDLELSLLHPVEASRRSAEGQARHVAFPNLGAKGDGA